MYIIDDTVIEKPEEGLFPGSTESWSNFQKGVKEKVGKGEEFVT